MKRHKTGNPELMMNEVPFLAVGSGWVGLSSFFLSNEDDDDDVTHTI